MLRGLERLASTYDTERATEVKRLEPLAVGVGEVEINLDIMLPKGYKLNAEAPQLLQLAMNDTSAAYTFSTTETPKFMVNVQTDTDLHLNLTLYYCETDDQRLCMIHNTDLLLPLTVTERGKTSVHVGYKIPL